MLNVWFKLDFKKYTTKMLFNNNGINIVPEINTIHFITQALTGYELHRYPYLQSHQMLYL
jgi:hypothetical protein